MKVNLLGLFQHVAGSIPKRDGRDHAEFCLQEVYGHINDVIQGKHTLAEFAEHYCLPPPPASAWEELRAAGIKVIEITPPAPRSESERI